MKGSDPDPRGREGAAGECLGRGGVRYELLRRLGGGPTGDVHVARASGGGLDRLVCIKRLAGDVQREHVDAFHEEARLLATVRHANVVSLLAFEPDAAAGPFLVLELVEGLDLRSLRRGLEPAGRLADGLSVHVACAVLRALAAVQRYLPGLVHRDVTPHNVLVSVDGDVKLADFGIALALDRTQWSRPGIVKGKLGYMPPEQILGRELDVRTDLFAVGVVLFELLTGSRPWGPIRGARDLSLVVEGPPRPLGEVRPSIDPRLASAVDRLVDPDPGRRFETPEQALRAIAAFGAGELGSLRLAGQVRAVRAASMS
jgi:serine/threonine protein kinase